MSVHHTHGHLLFEERALDTRTQACATKATKRTTGARTHQNKRGQARHLLVRRKLAKLHHNDYHEASTAGDTRYCIKPHPLGADFFKARILHHQEGVGSQTKRCRKRSRREDSTTNIFGTATLSFHRGVIEF